MLLSVSQNLVANMSSTISRYGSSCLKCRKRKVRCDGSKPACKNCVRNNDRCIYSDHDSTVTRLQNALARSEKCLEHLTHAIGHAVSLSPEDCREKLRTVLTELKSSASLFGDGIVAQHTADLRNTPAKSVPKHIALQSAFRSRDPTTEEALHGPSYEEVCPVVVLLLSMLTPLRHTSSHPGSTPMKITPMTICGNKPMSSNQSK